MLALLPIFVPNDLGLQLQLNSIRSLNLYLEKYPTEMTRIYSGWCAKKEYWDAIQEVSQGTEVIVLENNIGKAAIVNSLFDKYHKGHEYFFTCDSDICFDCNQKDIFARLVNTAELLKNRNVGLLSLNQLEASCQLLAYQSLVEILPNSERISWAYDGRGLAGGALFFLCEAFRNVKYREVGAYGSDDGLLMIDMHAKQYFACCTQNICVIHPKEELKEGYLRFKNHILHGSFQIDEVQKMVDEFWSKS